MEAVKVIVRGALGKMGREVVNALCAEPDVQLVGAVVSPRWGGKTGDNLTLPDGSGEIPISADLDTILSKCQPDVMVDFTVAKEAMPAIRAAAAKGVNLVIGTTGFSTDEISEMKQLAEAHKIGIVLVPNFALGAALMMHLSKIAGKYMDCAEIVELHHNQKADAPSGTALSTARTMVEVKSEPFSRSSEREEQPSRGQELAGVAIHAVRLPGLMAHQEAILGAPGQILSIRHDIINRECYMPGVILAIKEVVKRPGFTYGLDALLNL